jgi:plasmid stability protein
MSLKAFAMAQLTVRNIDDQIVRALKERAVAHGRSAEAEHREILRQALVRRPSGEGSVAERAARLRAQFRSSVDSTDVIRADRDRDMRE